MEYVTTSTTGNAADFGDLTDNKIRYGGCSNAIRGLIGGGAAPSITASITYIAIATLGNTLDFGDFDIIKTKCRCLCKFNKSSMGWWIDPIRY